MLATIITHLPGDHPWQNHIHWFDTIDSTNTLAKKLALDGAPHGTTLIAGHQSAGRGRMGRSFQSPEGMGVYMSVLLRPECSPSQLMHLTCAAAVAACDAVEKVTGSRPGIKWTNDLVCEKRKLAGILTELVTVGEQVCAIVGIGINCCQQAEDFSPDIRDFAGSLAMVTGKCVDRAAVAAALVDALWKMDATLLTGKADMLRRYCADCITVGREISILRGKEVAYGTALAVDEEGGLIVRLSDGSTRTVQSGEVSIRGMYGYI